MAAAQTSTRERTAPRPSIVRPGPNQRVRSRVRVQWLALAAALTVLAGVVVAWALTNAADRVPVVSVAQAVEAGDIIDAVDLTVSDVAFDADVSGLVPAASLGQLVGRVATIDLQPGALLTKGMWADAPELAATEQSVGASLPTGRYPTGLARGDAAAAIAIDGDGPPISVRVLDAVVRDDGDLAVTLAIAGADAAAVARLSATDRLALVGLPASAVGAEP